jgi:DNA-binding winged helix-turn-helix (wHTH) protein
MSPQDTRFYDFGPFRLDCQERQLLRQGGQLVDLRPKAFEALHELVINHGRTVARNQLMQRIWPDTFVNDENLNELITELRDAFDDADRNKYIKTKHRRGYVFVARVNESNDESDPVAHPIACVMRTAFFAAVSAALFKSLPGAFGWALTQASASAGMGAFQGATAGVVWAGLIILGLTLYDFRRSSKHASKSLSSTSEKPVRTGLISRGLE